MASLVPSSSSSLAMFSDSDGCAMLSALAAAEIDPCSASARK